MQITENIEKPILALSLLFHLVLSLHIPAIKAFVATWHFVKNNPQLLGQVLKWIIPDVETNPAAGAKLFAANNA
jgi:hypothetical protein